MDARKEERSSFDRPRKSAAQRSTASSTPTDASTTSNEAQGENTVSDVQIRRTQRRRNAWYVLAGLSIAAGTWGLVAGWYFGLPFGGETRNDPFNRSWHFANLLQTIPHPALADGPLVPASRFSAPGTGFYTLREKFQSDIAWKVDFVTPSVLPLPKTTQSPEELKRLPQERLLTHDTDVRTSSRMILDNLVSANETRCIAILSTGRSAAGDLSCLKIPSDFPENRPVTLDRGAFQATTVRSAFFFDASGRALKASQGGSAEVIFGILNGTSGRDPTFITSATIGAESDSPSATPVVWIGGFNEVYKVVPRSAGAVSVTKYPLPISRATAIDTIFFLSADRGWVFARNSRDWEENTNTRPVMMTSNGGVTWQRLWYRWMPAPWVFAVFLFGMFAFERGTRAQAELRPVATKAFITDHGVSDNPIGLDDADALGLVPIATALSRFLRNIETKPTVAFAVTGPWGSGKSSLMNLVREDLADRGVCTVWFNAWHYQKEENLLAALLASIRAQAVAPLWTPAGINYRLRIGLRHIAQDPARMIVYVILASLAVFLLWKFGGAVVQSFLAPEKPPTNPQQTPDTFTRLLGIVGISGTALGGLLLAVKKIWDMFKPLQSLPGDLLASFSGTTKTTDLDQQLSFRYRFQKEFSTFCDVLRSPPNPGLVIFVDDLDRCGPRQTVDVLEAINFVTNAGKCFVILGFDESKVKAAVADVYKDTILKITDVAVEKNDRAKSEELVRFASHYLEKLVHLVIPVPKSNMDTVEKLLGLRTVPQPSTKERRIRRWRRMIVDSVAALILVTAVVAGASFAMNVLVQLASTASIKIEAAPATPARDGISSTGAQSVNANVQSPALPPKTFVSSERLVQDGLLSTSPWGAIPPSALVLAFILLVGIFGAQFIPRLSLIEPVVSDSPEFKKALGIWADAISQRRTTPRDVKRFINRLRFLAMRLRSLGEEAERVGRESPLDEAKLVSFAAIEDLDQARLGRDQGDLEAEETAPLGIDLRAIKDENAQKIFDRVKAFNAKFARKLYSDPIALETYRRIAGLVEERGSNLDRAESDEVAGAQSK